MEHLEIYSQNHVHKKDFKKVKQVLVHSLQKVHLKFAYRTIYKYRCAFLNLQELAASLRNTCNLCNYETCFLTFISTCFTPRTIDFWWCQMTWYTPCPSFTDQWQCFCNHYHFNPRWGNDWSMNNHCLILGWKVKTTDLYLNK